MTNEEAVSEFEIKLKCALHASWFCDCPAIVPQFEKLRFAQRLSMQQSATDTFAKGYFATKTQRQADFIMQQFGVDIWREASEILEVYNEVVAK